MTETSEWTKFDLDFKSQNGKTINTEELKKWKIQTCSCILLQCHGGVFPRSVGSELWIDEVEIICKN